eukprot:c10462_g1_i1.p1 GENE.c10462_g1_i1~~c10462_g1_i1.p1  ORF type:complete len:927 (-),score=180.30 c10462_g1_i1:83-2830(-)
MALSASVSRTISFALCVLVLATNAIPSPKMNEAPKSVDQSLVALQSEGVLDDVQVQICHGPEDCNEHGFCDTNNLCRCAPGWGGLDCTVEFVCPNNCSGNGICRAHVCFCYHGYTGRDCAVGLFCPNNCNGNGKCDRGRCLCDPGFDGADCSKEIGCAYKCVHGKCTSQVCVCEEGYHGVDCSDIDYCITNCSNHGSCKDKRCTCDFGYTGVVCSTMIPCPHNCSHRGECINGTCICDLGYTGLDCSEDCCPDQNSQCSAGKMCSYPPCQCHNDCNDNGICHRGRCICRQGYFGDDCALKYCPFNCSMHGSCNYAVGECTCDKGWKGLDCSEVECANDCHNRGECMLFGGTSRICLCEDGFTGPDCGEEVPCPGDCSGHGLCTKGQCKCSNGWDGSDCSDAVEIWVPCEQDCHGHGSCQDGVCVTCDEGWQGKFCNEAKVVAVTAAGAPKCPGEPECSSHGLCGPGGKCFCVDGWLGGDCATKKCPDDCNGRGDCKSGRCMCRSPYHSGPLEACEFIQCPNNCSGPAHGDCNKNTGQCQCMPPWTGEDCSVQPCPGTPECSSQGSCDHNTGLCDCLPDYTGDDCSTFMRCPNDCSANGVCFRGVCYCYSNYTGDSCRTIKRPPPPPGYDWTAPLREAQGMALAATSRAVVPPAGPLPADFTIDQKKDLFRDTYGDLWLKYWNLVHQTGKTRNAFVNAVTATPPSADSAASAQSLADQQISIFKQIFGENWNFAWSSIMQDPNTKDRFTQMFRVADSTYDDGTNTDVRGPGLPPPPPIARPQTANAERQNLFSDVFGEGDGLAMEMKIFGDKTKRDLFTQAFSNFLKENMQRAAADKRAQWEDDMMQLMTDAMGADGPKVLSEIYADPERTGLFRKAFAGYLEEAPTTVTTLFQTEEGRTSPATAESSLRHIPPPM